MNKKTGRYLQKAVAVLLSVLLVTGLALKTAPKTVFAQEEPIYISTLGELEAFCVDVNKGNTYEGKTVILTNDIDMSLKYGANIDGAEKSWTPIGYILKPFNGTFDGDGHTISGLYINQTSGMYDIYNCYLGLFGYIAQQSTIKNLTVDGSVTFKDTDDEKHVFYCGGIAGTNYGGNVINCRNNADITGNYPGQSIYYVGGVTGQSLGELSFCINTGDIKSYASGSCGAFRELSPEPLRR